MSDSKSIKSIEFIKISNIKKVSKLRHSDKRYNYLVLKTCYTDRLIQYIEYAKADGISINESAGQKFLDYINNPESDIQFSSNLLGVSSVRESNTNCSLYTINSEYSESLLNICDTVVEDLEGCVFISFNDSESLEDILFNYINTLLIAEKNLDYCTVSGISAFDKYSDILFVELDTESG